MASATDRKRKKKQFYIKSTKKGRFQHHLEAGMKGFMISCNNAEKLAIREAYNLLNEYADKLYGPEQLPKEDEEDDAEEEDMEKALQKEVSSLKSESKQDRRFQQVYTGVNNCVFIKTTLENPQELSSAIYQDLYETQTAKSRYIMRFLPVIGTCKSTEENIEKLSCNVLAPYFRPDAGKQSFIIRFKVRNNNNIGRNTVIPLIGDVVGKLNGQTYVKPENPDVVINVDIMKTVCCISVPVHFEKYCKYNLQEVVKVRTSDNSTVVQTNRQNSDDKTKGASTVTQEETCVDRTDKEVDCHEDIPASESNESVSKASKSPPLESVTT